jgi:hypothetical protein
MRYSTGWYLFVIYSNRLNVPCVLRAFFGLVASTRELMGVFFYQIWVITGCNQYKVADVREATQLFFGVWGCMRACCEAKLMLFLVSRSSSGSIFGHETSFHYWFLVACLANWTSRKIYCVSDSNVFCFIVLSSRIISLTSFPFLYRCFHPAISKAIPCAPYK